MACNVIFRMGLAGRFRALSLTLLLVVSSSSWAPASSGLELDPSRVGWSRLLFRASEAKAKVSIEVRLSSVSPLALEAALITDAGREAPPAGEAPLEAEAVLMTATMSLPKFDKVYRTEVWFLPGDAAALQRRRDKIGKEGSRKTFRYFTDGVGRVRVDPDSRREAKLAPETWTRRVNHFYPYPADRAGCAAPSDPAVLLFIVSAITLSEAEAPPEICVFNKKTPYRVRLRAAASRPYEASFTEIRQDTRHRVNREIAVLKVRLEATSHYRGDLEPDPFEFFELSGDIEILLDAASRVPVKVSGEISGIGKVEFFLTEVTLGP